MKPPIFIGGVARSGTTLLQVMFDSHPGMAVGAEISYEDILSDRFLDSTHASTGVPRDILAHTHQMVRAVVPRGALWKRAGVWYEAVGEVMAKGRGADRWGFKVMHQIRDGASFLRMFQGGRLIHVLRDGLDVFASWKEQNDPNIRGSMTKRDPREIAQEWVDVVGAWESEWGMLLRYEQLVTEPARSLEYLCWWLGEPYDADMLRYHERPHALFESGFYHPSKDAVKRPLSTDRIGRWRAVLSFKEVTEWLSVAGELHWRMGYSA